MRASRLLPTKLMEWLRRLGLDQRGIAAVEFALVLPIMLVMFLGMSEVQPGFAIQRKLGIVARTVADLSARQATISPSELKTVFGAALAIMRPYDSTAAKGLTQMVVSSVKVTKVGQKYVGTVQWSCNWNIPLVPGADDLPPRLIGSTVDVPGSFQNDATSSFMYVDTQFPYTPGIGYQITNTIRLKKSQGWAVRDAASVTYTSLLCPT